MKEMVVDGARKGLQHIFDAMRPHQPWLSPGSVRYLRKVLEQHMNGLEWGSGKSTCWLAKRLGHLTSVEHDLLWYERISVQIPPNVDYRYLPLDHPETEPTRPDYEVLPKYVEVAAELADFSLDLALVDGHYRQACVRNVVPKVRCGGLLVIDNSDWLPLEDWGVPMAWTLVHQSRNLLTETTIWRRPEP